MRVVKLSRRLQSPGDRVSGLWLGPAGRRLVAWVDAYHELLWWDSAADALTAAEYTGAGSGLDEYAGPAVGPDLGAYACHHHEDHSGVDYVVVSGAAGGPVEHFGWTAGENDVRALAFTPDGRTLLVGWATAYGPAVARYPVGRPRAKEPGPIPLPGDFGITCLAAAPGGRAAAAGGKAGAVVLVDLKAGAVAADLRPPRKGRRPRGPAVQGLTFSPDGRTLLARADGAVRVWDLAAGEPGAKLTGPKGLAGAAFAPDGRTVLTAGLDGAVTVWDPATWAERDRLAWKVGPLTSVAVAPDGTVAAAGGDKGRVVVWDLDG